MKASNNETPSRLSKTIQAWERYRDNKIKDLGADALPYFNTLQEKKNIKEGELEAWERRVKILSGKLPDNTKKLLDFIDHLEIDEAIHKNTCAKMQFFYLTLLIPLVEYAKKPFLELTEDENRAYFKYIEGRYRTDESQQTAKGKTKRFFKWLNGGEECPDNIKQLKTKKIKSKTYSTPGKKKFERWYLEEVRRLIKAASHPQSRAFISCLYDSMARVQEILNMNVGDLPKDFHKQDAIEVTVRSLTGERTLYLQDCLPDLRLWLDCHPKADDPEAPLWINYKTKKNYMGRLTTQWVYKAVREAQEKAGLKEKYWKPHLFRKSKRSELAEQGWNELMINRRGGWSDSSKVSAATYFDTQGEKIMELMRNRDGKKKEPPKPELCPQCGKPKSAGSLVCSDCMMTKKAKFKKLVTERPDILEVLTRAAMDAGLV